MIASLPRRIEGYAIVSEAGMIANAAGIMPDRPRLNPTNASSSAGSTALMWSRMAATRMSISRIRLCAAV